MRGHAIARTNARLASPISTSVEVAARALRLTDCRQIQSRPHRGECGQPSHPQVHSTQPGQCTAHCGRGDCRKGQGEHAAGAASDHGGGGGGHGRPGYPSGFHRTSRHIASPAALGCSRRHLVTQKRCQQLVGVLGGVRGYGDVQYNFLTCADDLELQECAAVSFSRDHVFDPQPCRCIVGECQEVALALRASEKFLVQGCYPGDALLEGTGRQ